MPWNSAFNTQSEHVELTITGIVSRDDLVAASDSVMNLALKHDTSLVLTDCSLMAGGHSILDLYFLAKRLAGNPAQVRRFREAVLLALDPNARAMVRFWETACLNRGLNVRVFENRELALEWLRETADAVD